MKTKFSDQLAEISKQAKSVMIDEDPEQEAINFCSTISVVCKQLYMFASQRHTCAGNAIKSLCEIVAKANIDADSREDIDDFLSEAIDIHLLAVANAQYLFGIHQILEGIDSEIEEIEKK